MPLRLFSSLSFFFFFSYQSLWYNHKLDTLFESFLGLKITLVPSEPKISRANSPRKTELSYGSVNLSTVQNNFVSALRFFEERVDFFFLVHISNSFISFSINLLHQATLFSSQTVVNFSATVRN